MSRNNCMYHLKKIKRLEKSFINKFIGKRFYSGRKCTFFFKKRFINE